MTAAIVNHITRESVDEEWRYIVYVDADATQRAFDPATYPRIGQLWERVAESAEEAPDVSL